MAKSRRYINTLNDLGCERKERNFKEKSPMKTTHKKTAWLRFLLAFSILSLSFAAGGQQPKIAFKEMSWNFGKIKQGDGFSHEFVFNNEGDGVLTIKNVETSCGCAAAVISEKKVGPGKSGKIKVTFNSRGYSGEVTKSIFVDCDDPLSPRVELKILAAVDVPPQPRIDLDRFSYDAGLLLQGEDLQAKVAVQNKGDLELTFECAPLPIVTYAIGGRPAKFPVKVAPGKSVEVGVTLTLPNYVGVLKEFILFKSNDPLRQTITMNLNAYMVTKSRLKELFQKYKNILK
jgi:hypothetical protein